MVWNDSVRAALIAFLNALFPVGQILGFWHFSGEEVAQIMMMINLGLVFLGLVFKKGQQPGSPIIAASGSETAPTVAALGETAVDDGGGPQRRTMPPPPIPAPSDDPR